MEDIIILILFTYPGLMANYLHRIIIRGKQYDKPTEEYYRVALDFFLSAFITIISCAVYCWLRGCPFDLESIGSRLHGMTELMIYLPLSVIGAMATAAAWAGLDRLRFTLRNKGLKKAGKATIDIHQSVWKAIFDDEYIGYQNCVMAVYQDGKLIRAGMPLNVSDDISNDPWGVLTWTETARKELEQPAEERTLLINPVASAVNLETGITVDFYNGERYRAFTSSWAGQAREHSEPAAGEV